MYNEAVILWSALRGRDAAELKDRDKGIVPVEVGKFWSEVWALLVRTGGKPGEEVTGRDGNVIPRENPVFENSSYGLRSVIVLSVALATAGYSLDLRKKNSQDLSPDTTASIAKAGKPIRVSFDPSRAINNYQEKCNSGIMELPYHPIEDDGEKAIKANSKAFEKLEIPPNIFPDECSQTAREIAENSAEYKTIQQLTDELNALDIESGRAPKPRAWLSSIGLNPHNAPKIRGKTGEEEYLEAHFVYASDGTVHIHGVTMVDEKSKNTNNIARIPVSVDLLARINDHQLLDTPTLLSLIHISEPTRPY